MADTERSVHVLLPPQISTSPRREIIIITKNFKPEESVFGNFFFFLPGWWRGGGEKRPPRRVRWNEKDGGDVTKAEERRESGRGEEERWRAPLTRFSHVGCTCTRGRGSRLH